MDEQASLFEQLACPKCPSCNRTYEAEGGARPLVGICGNSMCDDCVVEQDGQCHACPRAQHFKDAKDNFQLIESIRVIQELPNRFRGARGADREPDQQTPDEERTTQSLTLAKKMRFADSDVMIGVLQGVVASAVDSFITLEEVFPFGKKLGPNCIQMDVETYPSIARIHYYKAVRAAKEGVTAAFNMAKQISAISLEMVNLPNVVDYTEEEKQQLMENRQKAGGRYIYTHLKERTAYLETLQEETMTAFKAYKRDLDNGSLDKYVRAHDKLVNEAAAVFCDL